MQTLPEGVLGLVARRVNDRNLGSMYRAGRGGGLPALAAAAHAEMVARPGRRAALREAIRRPLRRDIAPLVGVVTQAMHIVEEVKAGRNSLASIAARRNARVPAAAQGSVFHWKLSAALPETYASKAVRLPDGWPIIVHLNVRDAKDQVEFWWGNNVKGMTMGSLSYINGRWVDGGRRAAPPRGQYTAKREQYFQVLQLVQATIAASLGQ